MKKERIYRALRIFRQYGLAGAAQAVGRKLAGSAGISLGPVTEAWTDYMNWLIFANAGMLWRGNVYCFDYAIKNLPSDAPMVEIGSFCGLSTNMISYLKEKNRVKNPLVTCDRWIFEGAEHGGMLGDSQRVSHEAYREFVKDTFVRNVQMFSGHDLPYTIELFSDEFFAAWAAREVCEDVFGRKIPLGGGISFCYIDGNHSYEFAKRDFENADRYLDRGGFLLFDDSGDGSGWEVCNVVREVLNTKRYELVAKNPNYFFRKK